MATQKAVFAAGCFWGVQDAFDAAEGVVSTVAGYAGGHAENPTYNEVCSGKTGHAESVEVTYDPEKISYRTLLELFFRIHDPTTPNRQGPDVGSQYRSAVFYSNEEQKKEAASCLEKEGEKRKDKIVTQIAALEKFYPAEGYHQHYHRKKGGSCRIRF